MLNWPFEKFLINQHPEITKRLTEVITLVLKKRHLVFLPLFLPTGFLIFLSAVEIETIGAFIILDIATNLQNSAGSLMP